MEFQKIRHEIHLQKLIKNRKGDTIRNTYKNYPTGGFKKITDENINVRKPFCICKGCYKRVFAAT